jgi:hypothetical protein
MIVGHRVKNGIVYTDNSALYDKSLVGYIEVSLSEPGWCQQPLNCREDRRLASIVVTDNGREFIDRKFCGKAGTKVGDLDVSK